MARGVVLGFVLCKVTLPAIVAPHSGFLTEDAKFNELLLRVVR